MSDKTDIDNFKNVIADIKKFYDSLSLHIFSWVPIVTPLGFNYETYILGSASSTLKTISNCIEEGQLNDALALCRNYYELLTLNLYLSCYINDNPEESRNRIVDKWMKGIERVPDFNKNMKYIKNSLITKDMFKIIKKEMDVYEIKRELNNHMHYNSFEFILLNDENVYYSKRESFIKELEKYLLDIATYHFFIMFTINPNYMMSSDYKDCLEFEIPPDPSSLNWIAPFIQDYIDKRIKGKYTNILNYFKLNTEMEIE